LAFSSLSLPVKTSVRRSSIPVVLTKWSCLVLLRQQSRGLLFVAYGVTLQLLR
jgi:hypothetical protein